MQRCREEGVKGRRGEKRGAGSNTELRKKKGRHGSTGEGKADEGKRRSN